MRLIHFLTLAAAGTAFVLPDEDVLNDLAIQAEEKVTAVIDKLPSKQDVLGSIKDAVDTAEHATEDVLDQALAWTSETAENAYEQIYNTGFDADGWLESAAPFGDPLDEFDGPPHRGPPHGKPPHSKPPHKKPGHKKPHRGPHHHKPNKTVYQLITESKYTTELAKLISDDDELVEVLNGTTANYTFFAPTDRAFKKIPEHAPKPSKEVIRKVLLYHVAPGLYPAGRVLGSPTIPTLYNESALGTQSYPQRLAVKVGFKGIAVNFYSKIVAINIPASNGIIHGVDSLLIPPPKVLTVLTLLPQEFSTLTLGLVKTGLFNTINTTVHAGGTFFAPPNSAFKKLGPKINGFLFSKFGAKYLKALLQYHVVANQTLYSNAYYDGTATDGEGSILDFEAERHRLKEEAEIPRKGSFHFDFPTLLHGRNIAVDIGRFGPFISYKINGFTRVFVTDGIAKDGVIHAVRSVLIPPKQLATGEYDHWDGEEQMGLEDFKDRLLPFVDENEHWDLNDDEHWDL